MVAMITACSSRPAEATPQVATSEVAARECPIVVDIRWKLGLKGKPLHRSLWISGEDEPAGTSWREIDLDGHADAEGQRWLDDVTRYRDHGFARCDQAFDALRAASGGALPAEEFVVTYGRKNHLVLPSPKLDRAVILHWREGQRGIVELPSLREIPWTIDANWGDGHRWAGNCSWSGDGTRLALVRGGDGYAGPGKIAEQHSRVLVLDSVTGRLVREVAVERGVNEISFSPDGLRLGLLVTDYYLGDSLLERWSASLGHGRPYNNLYVQIVDLATGEVTETEIARDLPEVTAHIMWDPDGVTARGWDPP